MAPHSLLFLLFFLKDILYLQATAVAGGTMFPGFLSFNAASANSVP